MGAEDAAGDVAQGRLAALHSDAERAAGRSVSWEWAGQASGVPMTWGEGLFGTLLAIVLGLAVLGGVSFLIEGVKTVIRWLSV